MKLIWTRPAHADRKQIRHHIARDNPAAALALDELISAKASSLVDHPNLGRLGRVAGTRELVAHQNYILIYVGPVIRCGSCVSCTQPGNGCRRRSDAAIPAQIIFERARIIRFVSVRRI